SCCSMHDCAPAQARMKDDHWEVLVVPWEVEPRWVAVPEEAILRRDNPDGRPIVCRTPNGFIRCFVPPAGTGGCRDDEEANDARNANARDCRRTTGRIARRRYGAGAKAGRRSENVSFR